MTTRGSRLSTLPLTICSKGMCHDLGWADLRCGRQDSAGERSPKSSAGGDLPGELDVASAFEAVTTSGVFVSNIWFPYIENRIEKEAVPSGRPEKLKHLLTSFH
jgi:hypothetical protein